MKYIFYGFIGVLIHTNLLAQTVQITFRFPADSTNFFVSLTSEKLLYAPSPAIGLIDEDFLNVGNFDITNQRAAMTEFEVKEPQIVKLDIIPKSQKMFMVGAATLGRLLYLSPDDKLTITISNDGTIKYEGKNAHYQDFLRDYFKPNFYEYLPMFGYKPTSIDNGFILPKVDSLRQARERGLQDLKDKSSVSQSFETFVLATINTEAYLMQLIVMDKKIRESRGVQLKNEQRKEIESVVLANFKVVDDAALLSRAYRQELRNFMQIPVTQKFPPEATQRYVLSSDAVLYGYQLSDEKLKDRPRQRDYLLTHWLNYAVTNQSDMTAARALLRSYEQTYPTSSLLPYFKRTIAAKEKMYVAQPAPDFTFKNNEGNAVSLKSLSGKPVCIAFCFNLKQHEYIFKPLEEAYRNRMTFLYLNVTPNGSYEYWQNSVTTRPGVVHLWASDEEVEALRDTYVPTMQYPFVLIDAQGKIVERWLPQEFPDNKSLQEEIQNLVRK